MLDRERRAWGLVVHMLADIFVAIICLSLLMLLLVSVLELWAVMHPETLPLDWRAYWASAKADWREGTALWLICATTLLPTFVHLVAALTLWQTQRTARIRQAVAQLQGLTGTPEPAECNEISAHLWWGNVWGILRAASIWVPVVVLLAWLLLRIWQVQVGVA